MVDLTASLRTRILVLCAKNFNPVTKQLKNGSMKEISMECGGVSESTIKRISRVLREMTPEDNLADILRSHRQGRCGRSSKLTPELRTEYLRIFQEYANAWMRVSERMLRAELIAAGHTLSRSTIHAHLKILNAKKKNLRIKPQLTLIHMEDRLRFILDAGDRGHGLNRVNHFYKDQFDTVHVDESWFYLERITNEIWVIDGIVVPDAPSTHHKSHIDKVMFLVAMARPRTFADGTSFDGKVGIWDLTEMVAAQRNSKNRPAGTMELKSKNMDADFYYHLFTKDGGVFQSIKEKMPWLSDKIVYIQQDGAKPHSGHGVIERLQTAGSVNGWRFRMKTQPAQSPDLNILDLGFFHSLKTRAAHMKVVAKNKTQLVAKIKLAYQQYPAETLDHIWASLFAVYNCILQCNGDNQYSLPHSGARLRHKNATTGVDLNIDVTAYNLVFNALN